VNAILERILETGKVTDSNGNTHDVFPTSLRPETGRALGELVTELKPQRSIEVGMAWGLSTLFICDALADIPNARHTTIDPYQQQAWHGIGLANVREAGYSEIVRHFEDESCLVLPRLNMNGEQFDFAFIDGSHLFDAAFVDFFYLNRMLNVGCCLVLDDIWMPSIQQLCRFVTTNLDYDHRVIENADDVAILYKVGERSRDWDYHSEF